MTSRLNPYLSFQGNARQAMEFYQGVFGGTLRLNTFGEFDPDAGPIAGQIMHGMLETPSGYTIMAADTPPEMAHNLGDTITVSISGDDALELRRYWDKLSASGKVSVPLGMQVWGDEFGACVDQFGIPWMVSIAQRS